MDQIADMLTRIRNAQQVNKASLEMPFSNFKLALANVLKENKYIEAVEKVEQDKKPELKLSLRYIDKRPAINGLMQVSKQGQRIYVGKDEIPFVKNGYGIAILSTPQGLLIDKEARKKGLGGEVICKVW